MAEIPIMPDDEELLKQYHAKIKSISEYYNKKELPPKEPEVVWDEDTERFSKNFNVEYSSYLKRNYGLENPEAFNDKWGSKIESWNRVVGRIKAGKELTSNNKEKIAEMSELGFDIMNLPIAKNVEQQETS